MTNNDDIFTFKCSGRKFFANEAIIGINQKLEVSHGYDGHIEIDESFDELSNDEKRELANHMIKVWTEYWKAATS